jgi:hypothetical protein
MKLTIESTLESPRETIWIDNESNASLGAFFAGNEHYVRAVHVNGKFFPEWQLFIGGPNDSVHVLVDCGIESLVGILINLAISFLFGLIVQALTPKPKKPDQTRGQPAFGIAGVTNTIAPGTPEFFSTGINDIHGHLIGSKTNLVEPIGGGLYRRMTFDTLDMMGVGPVQAILPPKLNKTNIADMPGAGYEIRLGTADQTVMSAFKECHMVYNSGKSIPDHLQNIPIVETTKGAVDKITITFAFANGVFSTVEKGKNIGQINTGFYDFTVHYKKNSETEWITAPGGTSTEGSFHFQGQTKDGCFGQVEVEFPETDRYDYKVRNIDVRGPSQGTGNAVLFNVQETLYITTAYPNWALLHICGVGSEQIQSLDSLEREAVVYGLLTDHWNAEQQMIVKEHHRSRAFTCRYILTDPTNGAGAAFDQTWFDDGSAVRALPYERNLVLGYDGLEERDYCDVIFNEFKPVKDWLKIITFEGDTRIVPSGSGKYEYIIDKGGDPIMDYADPGKIIEGSVSTEFGRAEPPMNVYKSTFRNALDNYKEVPGTMKAAALGLSMLDNAERVETATFVSITRESQAARKMAKEIKKANLVDRFFDWQCGVDATIAQIYDPVRLSFRTLDDLTGMSGFVGDGSTQSAIALDNRAITLEPSLTYLCYLFHRKTNKGEFRTVTNPAGIHGKITLASAFSQTVEKNDTWIVGVELKHLFPAIIDEAKSAKDHNNVELNASILIPEVYEIPDPLPRVVNRINTTPSETVPQQPIMAQAVSNGSAAVFDVAPGFNHYAGAAVDVTGDYVELPSTEPDIDDFFIGYSVLIGSAVNREIVFYDGAARKASFDSDPNVRGALSYRFSAPSGSASFAGYTVEHASDPDGPWTLLGHTTTSRFIAPGYESSTDYFRITPVSLQGLKNEVGRWIVQIGAGDSFAPADPDSVSPAVRLHTVTATVLLDMPLARDARRIIVEFNETTASGTNLATGEIDLTDFRDEDLTGLQAFNIDADLSDVPAGTIVFARARVEDYFENLSDWVDSDEGVTLLDEEPAIGDVSGPETDVVDGHMALFDGTDGKKLKDGGPPTPADADYLVKTANANLTAERVVTDTSTVTWDFATAGQAKAQIPNDGVTYAKIQNVSAASRILGRKTSGAGDIEELTLSEILDFISSAAQGDVLYRGASSWARLAAGTSGQFLKTLGASANPQWDTPSGSGDVAGPSSATDGHVALFDGTTGKLIKDGGTPGSGDVVGPSSAVDGHLAVFDSTTGKLIKDGGAVPTAGRNTNDPLTSAYFKDDFQTGGTGTGAIGEFGWRINSGGTTYIVSEANHPGIVNFQASGSASCGRFISPNSIASPLRFADTFDMYFVLRQNSTSAITVRIGLFENSASSIANPPANGIYFERLSTDTNWFGVTRSSSSQTRTDTSTAGSTSFIRFRLRRIDSSTIGFTLDGGTEVTATANIPTGTAFINIEIIATTGVAKDVDVDFVDCLITGLSR